MAKFDKVIPPGQEGKVHMVIEGKKVSGDFLKSATIRSNDPQHPVMTISMAGNIVQYVSAIPRSRIYLQGYYGEQVQKTVVLKSNEEDLDFAVTKVESNIDDKVTYDFGPGETEKTWKVNIYKNPKLARMSTYGTLTVHTNSEKSPTKTVQVQVITKGAISVQPNSVNFGMIEAEADGESQGPVTKSVTVLKLKGDFAIKDLNFSSTDFRGEIEQVQPGKRYNLKVTFTPPKGKNESKTHVGEMTILTDDPQEPELKVRLVARTR